MARGDREGAGVDSNARGIWQLFDLSEGQDVYEVLWQTCSCQVCWILMDPAFLAFVRRCSRVLQRQ